jgi:pimeloyl-ACP methyl ester carboxylesterase
VHLLHIVTVIAEVFAAGALATLIGVALIERAHPPRGRFVDIDGLPQHVVDLVTAAEAGTAGPPIVLIHGAGCNLEDMRLALGERLAARHRVILVDRPGMGWSWRKDQRDSSPAYQADVLCAVLDRLSVKRAVLVGHSWGGALAVAFALNHPARLAGLVLLAPPLYPFPRTAKWLYTLFAKPVLGWLCAHTLALPLAALFIGVGLGAAFLPQLPPRRYVRRTAAMLLLRPATFLANACDVAGLRLFQADEASRYSALAGPITIVTGSRDLIVAPRGHAMVFAAAVPQAKLVVLPGIGHMLHHAAADRVVDEIEKLISAAYSPPVPSPT